MSLFPKVGGVPMLGKNLVLCLLFVCVHVLCRFESLLVSTKFLLCLPLSTVSLMRQELIQLSVLDLKERVFL
jgi:hypothetical protein